jgi:hypothetical protein
MKYYIIIILIGLLSFSCVGDLDFDQADDIFIEPVVLVSLIHFNADGIDFPGSVDQEVFNDESEVHFFDSDFAEESITRVIIDYDMENTFDRDFSIAYNFLDNNDVIIHTTLLIIPANSHPLESDIFEENINLRDLLRTDKIAIEVIMEAGAPLNNDEFFHFKSAAKVFLHIENNDG